jgi:hypothetical protein
MPPKYGNGAPCMPPAGMQQGVIAEYLANRRQVCDKPILSGHPPAKIVKPSRRWTRRVQAAENDPGFLLAWVVTVESMVMCRKLP